MSRLWVTLLLAAGAVWMSTAALAQPSAPVISNIRFGVDPARTRVVIDSDHPLDFFVFTLAEQAARVVIDLERVDFALSGEPIGSGQRSGAGRGLVADYRFAHFSPERSRIVLDLAAPARVAQRFALPPAEGYPHHRLVIVLEPTSTDAFVAEVGYPRDRVAAPARRSAPPATRPGAHELVIVLDPGHGGDDSGAIGAGGVREEDVNLALALAVRDRLEARGGYRVVMTRSDDRRIDLDKRIRIAREADADLFLSIHADAAHDDNAALRGASVYTLADDAESRRRAETVRGELLSENPRFYDVDLSASSEEIGDILLDLGSRGTQSQSSAFAEALIPALREAGPLLRNTHRSKGLYVLLNPDVPAVLLEAGFITNSDDEARLSSAERRATLADAVVKGIDAYFDQRGRLYVGR